MKPDPFWKAFDILLHNAFLTPSQKLSMVVLTSNWPSMFNPTNKWLAEYTGQSIRTIQYNLKAASTGAENLISQGLPSRRPIIKRNYKHFSKPDKPFTIRWFHLLAFPVDPTIPLAFAQVPKTLLADRSLSPARKLFLIESRRYGIGKYPYTLRTLAQAIGLPFSYVQNLRKSLR